MGAFVVGAALAELRIVTSIFSLCGCEVLRLSGEREVILLVVVYFLG